MRARVWLFGWAVLIAPASLAAQVTAELFVSDLNGPVAFVADPVDPTIFFIVEQPGVVRVVRDRRVLPTPFLDLRDAISNGGERGLLGLAFGPPGTERLFVNFTDRNGDTVIARFRRAAGDPLIADVSSRRDLVWPDGRAIIEQPFSNHNGGHLAFGPDGYLYIGLGDGGSGGDPMHRAQDPGSLLGKMLRIDVSVPDDDVRGYRVPADNPFLDNEPVQGLPEIWAFGLRNPWRYHFDDPAHGGTGVLFVGDVGQIEREEVDYQPPGVGGLNYGWRLREGSLAFDERRPAAYLPLTSPVHDYPRTQGQAITGGFVYRGSALDPSWYGRYVFADFVAGRVWSFAWQPTLDAASIDVTDVREHTASLGGRERIGTVSSFGTDAAGEIYLLNHSGGQVWKIVPDLALVPAAPRNLRLDEEGNDVRLAWTVPDEGVSPIEFLLEITTADGMRVLRTEKTTEHAAAVTLASDERCVRARAVGRDGAGPPAPLACVNGSGRSGSGGAGRGLHKLPAR